MGHYNVEKCCEMCAVILTDLNIIIISLYRSPSGDIDRFLYLFEEVLNYVGKFNAKIIIGTDLNIDLNSSNTVINNFNNIIRSCNLYCSSLAPTRFDACLDYIFTTFQNSNCIVSVVNFLVADHSAIVMSLNCKREGVSSKPKRVLSRVYSEDGFNSFNNIMTNKNWDFIYNSDNNMEEIFTIFLDVLIESFNFCFPIRYVNKVKNKCLKWYNDEFKAFKIETLKFYNIYKLTKNEFAKHKYSQMNREYKRMLRQAKGAAYTDYTRDGA